MPSPLPLNRVHLNSFEALGVEPVVPRSKVRQSHVLLMFMEKVRSDRNVLVKRLAHSIRQRVKMLSQNHEHDQCDDDRNDLPGGLSQWQHPENPKQDAAHESEHEEVH
jgi:hypothetical protein